MSLLAAILSFPLSQPVSIFLLVLIIILIVPILFNRLRIPHIVGMIIAGMAIGPYGFNLLERDASFEIFGQVGILYLMFLASVEIDMFNLKKNLRRGALFGILSFLLPMTAGVLVTRWAFDASWPTAILIASMLASHTLISYPVVTRFGLGNQKAAVIAVCGTIVAVFLALVALAQVVAIENKGYFDWLSVLTLLGFVVIYALIIGYAFPWLTRRFFRRHSEPVTQFIFILALVLTASMLAQVIGLEAILGAFYAGLVLNRFIPSRSALMNRIKFVGNAIFIPYFLIGVGMLINVRVIFNGWGVITAALVMTATALLCKWLAAAITQRAYRMSSTDRNIMFGLSSGKAAATIAATMVGYQYGLLNEDLLNGAVIMILLCCLVASITTQRAAIRLRVKMTEEEMQDEAAQERVNARQVVAVANPMTATGIMQLALLMRHPGNTLPLTALFIRNTDDAKEAAYGRAALRTAAEYATAIDLKVDPVERFDNNIVNGIINVLKEKNGSDIILGLHRKTNMVDTFYGKTIEQLLATTNKNVIMARTFVPIDTIRRIIILVPKKAEYETGFRQWVERMGNLATQLGCRLEFIAYPDTFPYIRSVLASGKYNVRTDYLAMKSWDDFIILSSRIAPDDLFVAIGARRTSVSFNSDLENLPMYLQRYFSQQNLVVIYPEQFGSDIDMPAPLDALSQPITANPTPFLINLQHLFKK